MTLRLKSQEDCKTILSDLENTLKVLGDNGGAGGVTDEERKVATFYKAAMDENAIEELGVKPLLPLLELCDKAAECIHDKVEFAKCLGTMALKYGIRPFFSIDAGPDKKNSEHSIAQISQGGIRLPDRDYYFDEDKEDQRVAYKKTMALLLKLSDDSTSVGDEMLLATVEDVYNLEKNLAEAHMTKTENRDPHDTYNKMTIEDVTKNGDGLFDFGNYFYAATGKTADGKNVSMHLCGFIVVPISSISNRLSTHPNHCVQRNWRSELEKCESSSTGGRSCIQNRRRDSPCLPPLDGRVVVCSLPLITLRLCSL